MNKLAKPPLLLYSTCSPPLSTRHLIPSTLTNHTHPTSHLPQHIISYPTQMTTPTSSHLSLTHGTHAIFQCSTLPYLIPPTSHHIPNYTQQHPQPVLHAMLHYTSYPNTPRVSHPHTSSIYHTLYPNPHHIPTHTIPPILRHRFTPYHTPASSITHHTLLVSPNSTPHPTTIVDPLHTPYHTPVLLITPHTLLDPSLTSHPNAIFYHTCQCHAHLG